MSPLLKLIFKILAIAPLVMVKRTPVKERIIPIIPFELSLSLRNITLNIQVIIGLDAAIKDEFVAVVYVEALKKKI
ncbi:hypothetical protein CBO05C_1361 [Clostridium botulinum B str. Osaka05]|uniref:Uncharacterized protein n=1 Tax=Clostridium botulinum B str. Osaka05 TaxID=1407017 RepID=A0A0S6U622_CLOBO|nr:hypothetical protein CBO05C_1361 [Clostridium botulinum B str. Osaka05]